MIKHADILPGYYWIYDDMTLEFRIVMVVFNRSGKWVCEISDEEVYELHCYEFVQRITTPQVIA